MLTKLYSQCSIWVPGMFNIPVHIKYTMSHIYHPLPVPATRYYTQHANKWGVPGYSCTWPWLPTVQIYCIADFICRKKLLQAARTYRIAGKLLQDAREKVFMEKVFENCPNPVNHTHILHVNVLEAMNWYVQPMLATWHLRLQEQLGDCYWWILFSQQEVDNIHHLVWDYTTVVWFQ